MNVLGLRELPADGMFASTTTDHEDLHIETASNKPDVSWSQNDESNAASGTQPQRQPIRIQQHSASIPTQLRQPRIITNYHPSAVPSSQNAQTLE